MTADPRTQVHTSDLSPDDFGILAGKIVSRTGLAGPYELTEGTIADYENQSGKPELVWYGGTEADPFCIWVSFPDDVYLKLKWPTPSEAGFCDSVKTCLIADLEKGGGERDKYIISDLAGPTWQIVTVIYGDDDTEVDFSDDDGESLVALMGALNGSENLPEDWLFSISGGYLVLSVPYGTGVTLIELPGGLEMEFTEPSVLGEEPSALIDPLTTALAGPLDAIIEQYEELLATYTGLLGESVEGSAATTEAAVETAYSAYTKAMVRWTDADGDERVSYKDPVNGWYHPVYKEIAPVQVFYQEGSSVVTEINIHTLASIPTNARFAWFTLQAEGGASIQIQNDITGYADGSASKHKVEGDPDFGQFKVRLNDDGTVTARVNASAGDKGYAYVTAWSR